MNLLFIQNISPLLRLATISVYVRNVAEVSTLYFIANSIFALTYI